MADEDGPQILRPVPRRPFTQTSISPTPPNENLQSSSLRPPPLDFSSLNWLTADHSNGRFSPDHSFANDTPMTRPSSYRNLTASTLSGIYSPASTSSRDRYFGEREESMFDSPWDTGARTPIHRPSVDDATFKLMRNRSHMNRRRSSIHSVRRTSIAQPSTKGSLLSLTSRASLLFCLGVGYGLLVTRSYSRTENSSAHLSSLTEGIVFHHAGSKYLTLWGFFGVALGALLPWFDGVWEQAFGHDAGDVDVAVIEDDDDVPTRESDPATDWTLVIRAVGAFVGICFAIRKLTWTSTLQVCMALAMANPLLWWLIDRSKPGFLLSAAVGVTGSMFLLGTNPEVMPPPSTSFHLSNSTLRPDFKPVTFGGFARQETIESGVWILSVLFCSCVCFGNIGRRLAKSNSGVAFGRWAAIS